MRPKLFPAIALAVVWLLATLKCIYRDWGMAAEDRPAAWAAPLRRPGLPNLYKVSDDLYRGAQPTAEGMRELRKMGIKTMVNLRSAHSDKDALGDAGLALEEFPMSVWHAETEDAIRFLKIVTDKAKAPVFVHCQHGADRTGTMCGLYRIVVQGWSKDDAIREMTRGGFGHHIIYWGLPRFLRDLDVEALKRSAGIGAEGSRNP